MAYERYKTASAMAQGQKLASLVLKNAKVLDVYNEEWINADVAIHDGVIIGVGNYNGVKEIECKGKYIVPGFIDAHLHLESTLVNPRELVFEAAKVGTTTFVVDPHEAANVAGLAGVQYMLKETEDCQATVYVMAPSCVPAVPGEDSGAILDAAELRKLKVHPRIRGLGEVMDCQRVITGDDGMMAKLRDFEDRVMDGHIIGLTEKQLAAYALAGITTNHEAVSYEEAKAQVAAGIYVFIREGSAAHNLETIVQGLVAAKAPTDRYGFCTDDKHIEDIRSRGHISENIRKAIELGIPTVKAYKMASTNPAQCYGFKHLGAVAPGKQADLVLLSNPNTVKIYDVLIKGEPVELELQRKPREVPMELLHTVHIGNFTKQRLSLPIDGPHPVINIVPGQLLTTKTIEQVPSENGEFVPNGKFNKITCIERHHGTGRNGVAVLKGFSIKNGAIATSFAHDAHNLIVVGDNDNDMMAALDRIRTIGGGYVIASCGKIIAELPLEVMGLITNRPHEEVDAKVKAMKELAYSMGVSRKLDPFINLSFLALTVIPEIRVTTHGLAAV